MACIQCAIDLPGGHLNSSVSWAQRTELDQLFDCHIQDLDMINAVLQDVIEGCDSSQALLVLSREKSNYFILSIHMVV